MSSYTDRPWQAHYDPGIPTSYAPYPDKLLHEYLIESAQRAPDATAMITSARLPLLGRLESRITYAQLDAQSDALATALQIMGLQKGERVAIVLPNVVQFAIAFYGVLKAGGIVAATNPTYPAPRMAYQLNDCDAKIVITLSLFYDLIKQVQAKTKIENVIVTNVKEYLPPLAKMLFTLAREKKDGHHVQKLGQDDIWLPDVLNQYNNRQVLPTDTTAEDVALFQYTGGTTGISKGAMLTHKNLVANTIQVQGSWINVASEPFASLDPNSVKFLGILPMFHAAGLVTVLGQAIPIGAQIILVPNPRDIGEIVDLIQHYRPHAFSAVPALYNAINNHPRIKSGEVDLSSFIISTSGTAPLSDATKRTYEQLSGNVITEGYGMSECVVTHANPIVNQTKLNSVGFPYPDTLARIVSLDDPLQDVPVGEIGEIIINGPTVMRGYHKLPTESANVLRQHPDGKTWMHTGDIGRMDADGYFYIVDRKKDMAIIGGFNVYPSVVDNALAEHPAVLDVGCAAIPHPDKVGQEAIKAWIVLREGHTVTEAELMKHCEQYLAPYEIPRRFAFVDAIPRTAVGKVLRRELVQSEAGE